MKKLLLTIYVLTIFSCSDFTDVGLPRDQITKDLVFRDESLANAAMAGVYRSLEGYGFLSGSYSGANVYLGCYVDELTSYENSDTDLSQYFLLSHNATSSIANSLWSTSYNQIYNINSIIEGLQNSSQLDDAFKKKLLGEALVLRAILHLYLANTFGDIPFIETTSYEDNRKVKRDPQILVFEKINIDLKKAVILLPETSPKGNRLRPTKMAANAILARLAYHQNNWDTAIEYSSEVINNAMYAMEPNIDDVFLRESSSTIWQLLPYEPGYNTMEGNLFVLLTAPPSTVSLTDSFMEGFEQGDLRRTNWVGEIKDDQNKSYYYPFKYKESSITNNTAEYSVLLRIEELYLIRAEAYVQKNQLNLGLADLNKIRNRANLPKITSLNQDLLLSKILQERRYELFTEFGHRFEDLKHFGSLDQQMAPLKPKWKSSFKWWPIPENELVLNPNLYPQNDGY